MIYMPYQDYRRSAKCLSDAHLREQRVSCMRVINVLCASQKRDREPWMADWENHLDAVLYAIDATIEELRRRKLQGPHGICPWMLRKNTPEPSWLGESAYHDEVKQNLLKADPAHYGKMGWTR